MKDRSTNPVTPTPPVTCSYTESAAPEAPSGPAAEVADGAGQPRPTLGWWAAFIGWLVGVFSGMAISDLNIMLGFRGRAGVSAIAAVIGATILVRKLGARTRLRRYAPWLLLPLAAVAAAVDAFSLGPGARVLAIVFLVLMTCAAVPAAKPEDAARFLAGAAVTAVGVAVIGHEAATVANRDVAVSAAVIGAGVAVAAVGPALLAEQEMLVNAALAAVGIAVACVGVALLASQGAAVGAALIVLGAAVAGVGSALLADLRKLVDAALAGAAVADAGFGAVMLAKGDMAAGTAFIGVGLAVAAIAMAMLAKHEVAVAAAGIGAGIAALGIGVALLAEQEVLFSAAAIGVAGSLVVCGVAIIGVATLKSAAHRWASYLTGEDQEA